MNPFADLIPGQTSPMFTARPVYRERAPEPPPRHPEDVENARLNAENTRLQMQNTKEEMAERRRKEKQEQDQLRAQAQTAASTLMRGIQRFDRSAIDANDNGGLFETGTSGWLASPIRGKAAYSLRRDLDMPGAIAAIDTLIEMRRQSPTGAAVGNVTEKELLLLKDKIATIDPNQDHDTFMRNIAEGKQAFYETLKKINPRVAHDYLKSNPAGVWLRKDGGYQIGRLTGGKPQRQPRRPRVIDFNSLPE